MAHFYSYAVRGHGVIDHVVPQGAFGVNTNLGSNILGAATEIDADGEAFQGGASIQLLNIASRSDGFVHVRINVLWNDDLNVKVSLVHIPNPRNGEAL